MAGSAQRIEVAVWLTDPYAACWNLNARQRRRLVAALPCARIVHCRDAAAFRRALPRARVALTWVFEQAWLDLAPRLEWIATPSAGRDYFHVARPGLDITYGSFHGRIIGETVAAMLLAENRGLLPAARAQAAGDPWPRAAIAGGMRLLKGTHAAIVGFGHIGAWIGRCLKPFGVRLTGLRRHPRAAPRPDYFADGDSVIGMERLDALLPEVDHLILALPGDTGADNLIDARRLARLQRGAALYNIGRGNAVNEAAVAAALRSGRLRAACLDVFRREPLPAASPLRRAPNLLVLPHASAIAPEYLDLCLDEFIPLFRQRYG
jgi:phosphoglycerate dehydrogenase-like enzyme